MWNEQKKKNVITAMKFICPNNFWRRKCRQTKSLIGISVYFQQVAIMTSHSFHYVLGTIGTCSESVGIIRARISFITFVIFFCSVFSFSFLRSPMKNGYIFQQKMTKALASQFPFVSEWREDDEREEKNVPLTK